MDSGKSLLNFLCLAHIDFVNKREHCCQEKDSQNFRGIISLSLTLLLYYSQCISCSIHYLA